MADYDENMVITKEMIKSGIKAKLVVFAEDPNADHGGCRAGKQLVFISGGTRGKVFS